MRRFLTISDNGEREVAVPEVTQTGHRHLLRCKVAFSQCLICKSTKPGLLFFPGTTINEAVLPIRKRLRLMPGKILESKQLPGVPGMP